MNPSATLIGLIAIGLWSSLAVLTAATGALPPFQLAALTFAIGGSFGLIGVSVRGNLSALRQPWQVWVLGIAGLFGYHALYFAALRLAAPAEAGLIAYLWPLLIVLMSALLPGEHLRARHVLGACLGLGGVAVLLLTTSAGNNHVALPYRLAGYSLALACAFVWAAYSVLSRRFKDVPSDAVAGFCLATAILAAFAHLAFETTVWPVNALQWLAVIGLGLGPVGLAFYVWDHGVKHGDIRLLGVAAYAAPVLSTLGLVAAGFAQANTSLAIACILIVAGAAVASFSWT